MIKVLNLYAGIGGNRKLWTNCRITAVERNPKIAKVYQDNFPEDRVIVGDAHSFLETNYKDYDFIWASPPCQSHSKMIKATRHEVKRYPDMSLYQEILLLQSFFKGKWVIENVIPHYKPLIKPSCQIGRHYFWANFIIPSIKVKNFPNFSKAETKAEVQGMKDWLGIHFEENIYYEGNHSPAQILRNAVYPELGLHIFNQAFNLDKLNKSKINNGQIRMF